MLIHNGAPVDPDAAGCCVGLVGVAASGYTTCVSEPTTGGSLYFLDQDRLVVAFTCDRHVVVLTDPRPLSADDVFELNRRIRAEVQTPDPRA